MKVLLKADMEGVTGVVSPEQVYPAGAEYEFGRRMMMHDLCAVVDGILSMEGTQVLVYDMHNEGRNIDMERLPQGVSVISGRPSFEEGFCFGLDETIDALFLVGVHARLGTGRAVMPRTYDDGIALLKINDMEVGEIGCEAALAGEFGVPLAFVSSDAAGVAETQELLGEEIENVVVKRAVRDRSAVCLTCAQTRDMLRASAARAMRKAREMAPLLFETPTKIEVTFHSSQGAAAMEASPVAKRTGPNSLQFVGDRFLSAYRNMVLAHERRSHPAAREWRAHG